MAHFTQWKNSARVCYVERALNRENCIPEGQNSARKTGRPPGTRSPASRFSTSLHLSVLRRRDAIVAKALHQNRRTQGKRHAVQRSFQRFQLG